MVEVGMVWKKREGRNKAEGDGFEQRLRRFWGGKGVGVRPRRSWAGFLYGLFNACFCAVLWGCGFAEVRGGELTFVTYNLENYRVQETERTKAKAEFSREAAANMIASVRPDIVGVCEVGGEEALRDLQARLLRKGFELPEVELVEGPDRERQLALLSRYPLVERQSRGQVPYSLHGKGQWMRRGILDVSVEVGRRERIRLVGVHLKSRLPTPEGESEVRRMEAHVLREHLDGVFVKSPECLLVAYGDFNDTREQASIREVFGERGKVGSLVEVVAEDAVGDRWTHYWREGDVYARIDYVMVSRALWPLVVRGSGLVGRAAEWRQASDHRPVAVRIRLKGEMPPMGTSGP